MASSSCWRDPMTQMAQHGRVRPERHHGQVIAGQFRAERADGGGRGPYPLAAHRAGHVGQEDDAAPGPNPFPHDNVVVLGHRMLDQLVDGGVKVDFVGAAAVPDAGQLAGAAPGALASRRGRGTASRSAIWRARLKASGSSWPSSGTAASSVPRSPVSAGLPAAWPGRERAAGVGATAQHEPMPAPLLAGSSSWGCSSRTLGLRRSGCNGRPCRCRACRCGACRCRAADRTGESASTSLQPGAAAAGSRMNRSSQICRSTTSGVASTLSSRKIRPDSATTIAS